MRRLRESGPAPGFFVQLTISDSEGDGSDARVRDGVTSSLVVDYSKLPGTGSGETCRASELGTIEFTLDVSEVPGPLNTTVISSGPDGEARPEDIVMMHGIER